MNTAIILTPAHRHRSIYKAGNNIGADTTNRTVNLKDSADSILVRECRRIGLTISDGAREFWARGLATVSRSSANAFRTAQGMARNLASIFTPNQSPIEAETEYKKQLADLQAEKQTEHQPGAVIADQAIAEFDGRAEFIPAKGGSK